MEEYKKLIELLNASEADFVKFYEQNNQAAGTRVRNKMQEFKVLAQEIRNGVTEKKNK